MPVVFISQWKVAVVPGQAPDETAAKILSAASQVLAEAGSRRATVELVAKSAGVSHMTIYRRWPSKAELLRAAVVTDFARVVTDAFQTAAEPERDFAAAVTVAFTEMVAAMRASPVLVQALAAEPEQFMAGSGPDAYSLMSEAVPLVAEQLQAIADAPLPHTVATTLADTVIRLAHSLLQVDYPEQQLDTPADITAYAAQTVQPLAQSIADSADPGQADIVAFAPRRFDTKRSKITLVAASLAVVLVTSAGVTAVLGGSADPAVSPADLSRTGQSSAPTPAPTSPPLPPVAPVAPAAPPTVTPEQPDTAAVIEPEPAAPSRTPQPPTDDQQSPTLGDRESAGGGDADSEPGRGFRPGGDIPGDDRPASGVPRPPAPPPQQRTPGAPPAGASAHPPRGASPGGP